MTAAVRIARAYNNKEKFYFVDIMVGRTGIYLLTSELKIN